MKTIAIFFGGRSAEHDVSVVTAHIPIIQSLEAAGGFDIWPVYIAKDGSWYADKAFNDLAYFRQSDYEAKLGNLKKVGLSFDQGLQLFWTGLRSKTVNIDVAFPAMHGTYGEDGTLMGLLRLADIPFVGCDLEASAIAMDKVLAKQATEPLGIPSVPYVWFTGSDWKDDKTTQLKRAGKMRYPLFVKPVHLGSSIAITKVDKPAELENAIEVALHYDDKVIVEQGVTDLIEVTLPVIGHREIELGYVEQPLATFFGFEEKYLKGGGKKGTGGVNSLYSNIPAKISTKLISRVEELGRQTYRAIGASGISRIDFLIDGKTEQVYMNEINTLPGSLYHHNWQQKGVSGVDLVTKLVAFAEERYAEQKAKTYTFASDIINKASGPKTGPPRQA